MITIIPMITTFSSYCHIFFLWPCNLWFSCGHRLPLSPCSLILNPLQPAICLTPNPHPGAGLSSPLPHAMVILSKATVSPASLSFECAWSRRFPEIPGWAPLVAPHMCPEHPWAPQSHSYCISLSCLCDCPVLLKGQDHTSLGSPANKQYFGLLTVVVTSHMYLLSTWHVVCLNWEVLEV